MKSTATNNLNEEQRRAAEAGDGPVFIQAGPGTGKTKTLTARIAYLVARGKAKPEQILALTFTKKAAEEMNNRTKILLDSQTAPPIITTFHALCYELLQEGQTEPITFISDTERPVLIKALHKPAVYAGVSTRELALLISKAKNTTEKPAAAVVTLTKRYNAALQEKGLHDFDDLLLKTYELLQTDSARRAQVQARFTHILVDEFQDTNRLQYELLLCLRGNDNLFVIGDPYQSIYGFRGASGDIFGRFTRDFPEAMNITLTVNYRSASPIVILSNAIFAQSKPLTAHSVMQGQVRVVEVLNEYSEAHWVLEQIQRAIGGGDFLQAVSDDDRDTHRTLQDFAILYRSRSAAGAVQKVIAESGLPYQVVGDGSPYDLPDVQRVIALLRQCATGEAAAAAGLTQAASRHVIEKALVCGAPSQAANCIIDALGIEPTRDTQQFVGGLVRFDTIPAAINQIDAIAETAFYDPTADAVTLLTIHAAKGLEFSHVFLIGLEEGILPHRVPWAAQEDSSEEEQRLFYVAVTRARERLDILHTKSRGGKPAVCSRFVTDLPVAALPKTIDQNLAADQQRAYKRRLKNSQQRLL